MLVKEARVDIPPLVRAPVWAAILDVKVSHSLKSEKVKTGLVPRGKPDNSHTQ